MIVDLLIGYTVLAVLWLCLSAALRTGTDSWKQRQQLARSMFLAPVWPVVILGIAVWYLRGVWRDTGW